MVNCAGEDGVALGTDFDGFGPEDCPQDISTVEDMEKVWRALRCSGFTWRQIEKIASENIKRVINDTWEK